MRKFKDKQALADILNEISENAGMRLSVRGLCYILEQKGLTTKDAFRQTSGEIIEVIKAGLLPVDFVRADDSRSFYGLEEPDDCTVVELMKKYLETTLNTAAYYTPNWWQDEKYYIQIMVEKIDLVTLFQPIADKYHVPIANIKGSASVLQRAELGRRFKEAEDRGLECVLLYCGDHDPAGILISDKILKNLFDVSNIYWQDGVEGYDPTNLTVDRFGINRDFIDKHDLTWVENLMTSNGKDIGLPTHGSFNCKYVQDYLKKHGRRKCEANELLIIDRSISNSLVQRSIEKYLGTDAQTRFEAKRQVEIDRLNKYLDDSGARKAITNIINYED